MEQILFPQQSYEQRKVYAAHDSIRNILPVCVAGLSPLEYEKLAFYIIHKLTYGVGYTPEIEKGIQYALNQIANVHGIVSQSPLSPAEGARGSSLVSSPVQGISQGPSLPNVPSQAMSLPVMPPQAISSPAMLLLEMPLQGHLVDKTTQVIGSGSQMAPPVYNAQHQPTNLQALQQWNAE